MATLEMLISMGFPEAPAARAIELTGNKGVEEAMEWLLAHADDPAVAVPAVAAPANSGSAATSGSSADGSAVANVAAKETDTAMDTSEDGAQTTDSTAVTDPSEEDKEAKSIKCDECGKLFKSSEEVEFHAVKSGHSSFSESTEEKAPLTEEQKKQKLVELEEKMKARRRAKAEEEEKEAREKEKRRIEMGKNVAEIRRKQQEDEIKKLAEEKRREKLEDKMARQRVKEMIEADKEARRNKLAAAKGEAPPEAAPVTAAAPPAAKKVYDESRIQFRLPSGPPLVQTFKAKEPLSAVKLWLSLNSPPSDPTVTVTLATTFPRKVFTEDDMQKPLDVLGLVPSSALMVQYK